MSHFIFFYGIRLGNVNIVEAGMPLAIHSARCACLRSVVLSGGYTWMYKACPESKDAKVLNMYNIFNLQKRHCEQIACT